MAPGNLLSGIPTPPNNPYIKFNYSQVLGLLADGDYAEVQLQATNSDYGNCYSNILVISRENVVTAPTISAPSYVLCADKTLQFSSNIPVNVTTNNSNFIYSDNWASSNATIGIINNSGLLTAKTTTPTPNTFTVSDYITRVSNYSVPTFNGTIVNFSGTCKSNITNSQVITINSVPTIEPILPSTNPMAICYTGPNNTVQLSCSSSGGTWSSNSSSATVSNNGLVTGVSAGNATISYTVTNSSGCSKIVTKDISVIPCGCDETCSWTLTGNSPATTDKYIGTNNATDFVIKTGGSAAANERIRVTSGGNVKLTGITTNPNTSTNAQSYLLIDNTTGVVYKSNSSSFNLRTSNTSSPTQQQIDDLKTEVKALKEQIAELLKINKQFAELNSTESKLYQNSPNPFTAVTKIEYFVATEHNNYITVSSIEGKPIKTIPLNSKGKGVVELSAGTLSNGTYTYSIYGNGILIDTKLMVISK